MASSWLTPRTRKRVLGLALPLTLLALWWSAGAFGWVDPRLFAPLAKVVRAPLDPVVQKLIVNGVGASLLRNIEGALIGSAAGLALGFWLGFSARADKLIGPTFHVFRQIAMFAWIPLLTAWFGIGEAMRVGFIAIAAFKPMTMNVQEGIRSIPPQYLEVGRAMCLSRRAMLFRVILPAALPSISSGLQLAFIAAWLATIGVETLVSFSVGIGSVLREGQEHFHMEVVMFGIVLIGALGFLFNAAIQALSSHLLRWRGTI
ncbi:MAG: ABC transporter permease [Azoarcus sp.]|jgi:sulfonate transport system permease protein|nr:ABC transporter permease [Azoarcus sp.]